MDYYPLSDLLYRTVALTDDPVEGDVAVVEVYDTDAYGNTLIFNDPGADEAWFTDDDVNIDDDPYQAAPPCPFIFTGRRYDPETGIYYYRARYYHQELGRFLSRDRSYRDGTGLYEYVSSSPLLTLDPTGWALIPPQVRVDEHVSASGEVKLDIEAMGKFKGGTFALGVELYNTGRLRIEYDKLVRDLRNKGLSTEKAGALRADLTREMYAAQTKLGKAWTQAVLQDRQARGIKPGFRNPYKTNPRITGAGRVVCKAGKGLLVLSITLDIIEIASAPEGERLTTATRAVGRAGGALAGAETFATWAAPTGSPIIIGGAIVVGGVVGGATGEALVDPGGARKALSNAPPVMLLFGLVPIYNPQSRQEPQPRVEI